MEQNSLIDRLLELTLAIQHAAAMADWQEAARLTEERTPLFMELTPEQDATAMDAIRRIQEIDAAIAANAKATQGELQVEYSSAMKKIQAASKYHQAAKF
ncbi:Flagellar protein FliT [Caballeronia udeis]|uniref:Flagellar protein FliT n=1 Tax=Caballeronia udeis TaxID=1232866 RepID=A0A158F6S6_9BURK|nr:flagellar protein FliT [Caballeronia udeis]SAL15059.1 Flagellar protein FliT [Caballeronia udeis]